MYAAFLVEIENGAALLRRVIFVFLFERFDLGRDLFHRELCLHRAAREREEDESNDDRRYNDRNAYIVRRQNADYKHKPVVERAIDYRGKAGADCSEHRRILA